MQQQLLLTDSDQVVDTDKALTIPETSAANVESDGDDGVLDDRGGKKKRPTPENSGSSAEAVKQPCQSQ